MSKFGYNKGDLIVTYSQCVDCKNSIDSRHCEVFGKKPAKYLFGDEKCKERIENDGKD